MKKGSKNSGSSSSKWVETEHRIGILIEQPEETTVGENSYEKKTQVSFADKQTGCYGRAMAKEKVSAGVFEWKNGKSGTRNEHKESSTVRIGNKSGYTEVYKEETVRDVSFNKSSGSKKLIIYDDDDDDDDDEDGGYDEYAYGRGCGYGYGYGYDSDSDSD